jgi:hypothetical protein
VNKKNKTSDSSPKKPVDDGKKPSAVTDDDLALWHSFLEEFDKAQEPEPPEDQSPYSNAIHQANLRRLELDRHVALVARITQFTELRGRWSFWIIVWINGLLLFQICLLFLVGIKWLDYLSYDWLLPAVLLQVFGQIVGMGFVVVKILYAAAEAVATELPSLPPTADSN